jgi:hypothetical protein
MFCLFLLFCLPDKSVAQELMHLSLNETSSNCIVHQSSSFVPAVSETEAGSTIDIDDESKIEVHDLVGCLDDLMQTRAALQFNFIDADECFVKCPSLIRFWQQCQDLDSLLNGNLLKTQTFHKSRIALIKMAYSLKNLSALADQFSSLFLSLDGMITLFMMRVAIPFVTIDVQCAMLSNSRATPFHWFCGHGI